MSKDVMDRVKGLVRTEESCVLATSRNDKPHCSLMVYTADARCREIYMVTRREGIKYGNFQQNPNVSLLMDTRDRGDTGPGATALTINGRVREIADSVESATVVGQLLDRHPHLADFMKDAGVTVFAVMLDSFLLLDGLTDACYGTFGDA